MVAFGLLTTSSDLSAAVVQSMTVKYFFDCVQRSKNELDLISAAATAAAEITVPAPMSRKITF